jgi:hypothetical protein
VAGQTLWRLSLERAASTYSAAAHDTSAEPIKLLSWHPTIYTIRLDRDRGRAGVGLAVSYSHAPFGAHSDDLVLLLGDYDRLVEFAPEFHYQVARSPSQAAFRVHLGPVIDVWTPSGAETRTRIGASGGLSLELTVTAEWSVGVRTDLTVTGSSLTSDEESDAVIRESTMRRGRLALGITRLF